MGNTLSFISAYILPCVIIYIVAYGFISKINIFDVFIDGAKDGLKIVFSIMPTLIGLIVAIGVLRASSAFDLLGRLMSPILDKIGVATEIFTLALVKMFSSSAATGLLIDIFRNYGPDSTTGMMASILLSSTETVFYTISIYYLSVKITKTRYTLSGAITATIAGTIASIFVALYLI